MARKREIVDSFGFKLGDLLDDYQSLIGDVLSSANKPKLLLNIDATHSGRLTNNRVYPGLVVQDSYKSFIKPKGKPVLKNHDSNMDPIGRVKKSSFTKLKEGKAFDEDFRKPSNGVGSGVVKLDIEILDADSIEKFLDGRFQEFSTRQQFDGFFCSYCGNDFTKEYCGHYPGDTIKAETKSGKDKEYFVYGITGPLTYKEVSVVNIPGDQYTNINEMSMEDMADSESDLIICTRDDIFHEVSQLLLASSASTDSVDLFSSGKRNAVTASDRQALTGKSIFSIAGPEFNLNEEFLMDKSKINEEVAEEVEDLEVENNENTQTEDTSNDSEGESNQNTDTKGESEVVVDPQASKEGKDDETSVSDLEIAKASNKALVLSNKKLEASVSSLTSEVERVKGDAAAKDEEVARLRTSLVDAQSKLKEFTARQLLDAKLFLGTLDTAEIKDADSYSEKLAELSKRSLESLEDALSDLAPEIAQFKERNGLSHLTKKVENPVLDGEPVDDKDSDKEEPKKSPKELRTKTINSYL